MAEMALKAYLYDAEGRDREVQLDSAVLSSLNDENQLLWIDLLGGDERELAQVAELLKLDASSIAAADLSEDPPNLDNYGTYYQFAVDTAPSRTSEKSGENQQMGPMQESEAGRRSSVPGSARLNFLVNDRWLLTLHHDDIPFIQAFRDQDKAQTTIGGLSPPALAASLLDWHLGGYFQEVSRIEAAVDQLDERVLTERGGRTLLGRMVAMRRRVSKLRNLLVAQRSIFYGLSRPDFTLVAESGASPFYQELAHRFDRAVDEVERTRDVVVGSFELFTSRTSQQTNDLVKILTFLTAIIGFCAAVAGLLGMNFNLSIFHTGYTGFAVVTGGLIAFALGAMAVARSRGWI